MTIFKNTFFKRIVFMVCVIALILLNSCKSCSRSGRAELLKQQKSHNNNNNRTNIKSDKQVNINETNAVRDEHKRNSNSELAGKELSQLYERLVKAVIVIYTKNENESFQGSGFIISKSGLCVSNYHVFKDTHKGSAKIKMLSGNLYEVGEVIEKSEDLDYIIFNIKSVNYEIFPYLTVAVGTPKTGEDVFAIGNPKGLEHTLSKGIISQVRSVYQENDYLQITAEITHGSSGGPLFNMNGQVIGITTAGVGEADLNFAVNINKLNLERFSP